jgi:hypothetical protein
MHEDSLHAAAGRRAIVSPRASARHRYASPLVAAANGSARETAHRGCRCAALVSHLLPASADRLLPDGLTGRVRRGYWQAGAPSLAVVTTVFVVPTPMPQENGAGICVCVTVADQ